MSCKFVGLVTHILSLYHGIIGNAVKDKFLECGEICTNLDLINNLSTNTYYIYYQIK